MENIKKQEIDLNNFYPTIVEEQESQINIHKGYKKVSIYSSNKIDCKRLLKKIGAPVKIYYTKGKISGIRWELAFNDKRLVGIISKKIFIGQVK